MNEPEIGQEIFLNKNGDKKSVKVAGVLENKHQMGGVYEKNKVEVVTDQSNEDDRKMKIVVKDVDEKYYEKHAFPEEKSSMSSAERYLVKWNILRQKGIPTASSMRLVDGRTVAMGDMTADGSQFFGKEILCRSFEEEYQTKRSLTKIEELYLEINPRDIKDMLDKLFLNAWNNDIILPDDDYYDLLVHPDGTWQVMILDLTNLRPKLDTDQLDDFEELRKDMSTDVDYIRKHLLRIKQ